MTSPEEKERRFKLRQRNAADYKRNGNAADKGDVTVKGTAIYRNGKLIGFTRLPKKGSS